MVDGIRNVLVMRDAAPSPGFDWVQFIVPMLLVGTVWYLIVLRPQQGEQAARESMLASIAKGDEVVTSGGIFGEVLEVQADVLTIEIGERTKIRVERSAVSRKVGAPAPQK